MVNSNIIIIICLSFRMYFNKEYGLFVHIEISLHSQYK